MTNIQLAQTTQITGSDLTGTAITPIQASSTGTPLVTYAWNVVNILFVVAIWLFFLSTLIGGVLYLFSFGSEEAIAKSKKTFINSIIGLVLVFGSYNILNFFIGQIGPSLQAGVFSLGDIVGKLYNIITVFSGGGFLLVLLYGGFQYLTAAGNDESVGKSKKVIATGITGIIIVAFAYTIGHIILTLLGINIG